MNERDWKRLDNYLKILLTALHLSDWSVSVSHVPCEADSYAHVEPVYGQRNATLYVAADFREIAVDKARKVLTHELLHCHAAGVQHHIQDNRVRDVFGAVGYGVFRAGFDQHHENHLDAVALVLAPFMPSLNWATR